MRATECRWRATQPPNDFWGGCWRWTENLTASKSPATARSSKCRRRKTSRWARCACRKISEFVAFGNNGHFVRKPANGQFTLPTGQYRIFHWTINRKDDKGAAWTFSGYSFPETARFQVAADKTAGLEIGEPVQAVLKANEGAKREINFSLQFQGRQKESIEMLREGQRPRGPKLMLANASGTVCYTNTFEFG